MKLLPEDSLTILRNGLTHTRKNYNYASALEALSAFPEYAVDSEIQRKVIHLLSDPIPRDRRRAASILYEAGHPLGLTHLVYNTMTVHPVLGCSQRNWEIQINSRSELIRIAPSLRDTDIDLLMEDTRHPENNLHIDILAALPAERIIERIRPWLTGTERERIHAAYVLALKGNREGGPILKELLSAGRHIEFAFVGLSHIPDYESIDLFRAYLDPDYKIYKNIIEPRSAGYLFQLVRQPLEFRLSWSENLSNEYLLDFAKRHYVSSGVVYPLVPAGLLRTEPEPLSSGPSTALGLLN